MAVMEEPAAVGKRAAKRQKTGSPAVESPAAVATTSTKGLISKLSDNKPLPTLAEPQPLDLSPDEYQTVAASAVLAAALEQSRRSWVSDGIFERYWVKPEGGKNGKPPPPDNPDVKLMKSRGECRIRIEPHLFVAEMYVEERAKAPVAPKQPISHYRPAQQYQHRGLPPTIPPGQPQIPQQSPPRVPQASSPAPQSGTKPDPVISMLATRASTDPELKSLMKEVATGHATQEQLKVFQKHIDELTAMVTRQKQDQDDSTAKAYQQPNTIHYDGQADMRVSSTLNGTMQLAPGTQPYPPAQPGQQPQQHGQQQPWVAPALPVIIAFKDVGATEDRFLFPQHSILETLSPQHLLVSFIVIRKGHQAADSDGLEPNAEYWQPITIMIEVAYGREELLNCVRRWVKPAEEVRSYMEGVMQRCERAPDSHLALRLPFKSTVVTEKENVSKEATPVVEEHVKTRPTAKATKTKKGGSMLKTKTDGEAAAPAQTSAMKSEKAASPVMPLQQVEPSQTTEPPVEVDTGGRPRRATRKSVRISEG